MKKHPYEAPYKRVLCVCTAGLLRSPTAAWVLSQPPFNFNTRSAGIDPEMSPIPLTQTLLDWADEIVCMEPRHVAALRAFTVADTVPVVVLSIPDRFAYRDPELVQLIRERYGGSIADDIQTVCTLARYEAVDTGRETEDPDTLAIIARVEAYAQGLTTGDAAG